MLFILHRRDKKGTLEKRLQIRGRHTEHVLAATTSGDVRVVLAGPLLSDDGSTLTGGMAIVEAENREAVQAFSDTDPYVKEGIIETVLIDAYDCVVGAENLLS